MRRVGEELLFGRGFHSKFCHYTMMIEIRLFSKMSLQL